MLQYGCQVGYSEETSRTQVRTFEVENFPLTQ